MNLGWAPDGLHRAQLGSKRNPVAPGTSCLALPETEIGVRNQRFIFKTGLLRWSSDELQLHAVEEVRLEQALLGRLLDYGRIEVRGTGVANIRLPSVDDPVALRKALLEAMDNRDRPGATGPPNVAKSDDPIEQRAQS